MHMRMRSSRCGSLPRTCGYGVRVALEFWCVMAEVTRRKYVLRSYFEGMPKREDLELVEETLPPLKDGGLFSSYL